MTTHRVAIFSDVHFDNHHEAGWAAFRKWHNEHTPTLSIALGDILDLGMLSQYPQGSDDQPYAVEQIKIAVEELNALRGPLIMVPGNHSERWEKAVIGEKAIALRGAKGLTLREQMYAQGLRPDVKWVEENSKCPGVIIGKQACLVRHGHKQAGRYGAVQVAAKLLREVPTMSQVVGHHHRAQLQCQTVLGKTIYAIANPHMSGDHEYNPSPNWQRGFTVLEFYGRSRLRDCETFTPYLVLMDEDGHFVWNGKRY